MSTGTYLAAWADEGSHHSHTLYLAGYGTLLAKGFNSYAAHERKEGNRVAVTHFIREDIAATCQPVQPPQRAVSAGATMSRTG